MIDIHAHVLSMVDDGSISNQASISMIEEAKNQGVTAMILTPHYRFENKKSVEQLKNAFDDFCALCQDKGVDLYLGQEIFYDGNCLSRVESGKNITLAQSKFVLLEFSPFEPIDIPEVVYEFVSAGFKPIVAHAERYLFLTISDALEIKGLGGYIQVNAQSVAGESIRPVKKMAKKLLKNGVVDFIASDVHHNRKNYMQKAYNLIKKRYGEQTAERLFNQNALQIIKGQA